MMAGHQRPWIPTHSTSQEYLFPLSTSYKSGASGSYQEVASDEAGIPSHIQQTFKQRYFGGIKRTLRGFAILASVILIINVSWLGAARAKYGIKDGYGTLKEGPCDSIESLSSWLHFAINVLSTLLLTGSNAFMAAFCCPSREEVDKAHQRGKFLHVGVLNLGNLRRIAFRKGLVVVLLAISSIPFHLLYNSLVFTSLATNSYYWSVVTEDFLTGAPFNLTGPWLVSGGYPDVSVYPYFNATPPNTEFGDVWKLDIDGYNKLDKVMYDYFDDIQTSAPSWERLENKDCIQAYSNAFQSGRRNVVLVSSTKNDNNNSMLQYRQADAGEGSDQDWNWWICSETGNDGGFMTCNARKYLASAETWTVFGYPVEYCYSQKTEDTCSVKFSMNIMLIVVACNALKVFLMIGILFRYDAEKILTSVGDAAKSFLIVEDQTTHMMCLANKREMRKFWQERGLARQFSAHRLRWGAAVSRKRWVLFFVLMSVSFFFIAISWLLAFGHLSDQGVGLDPASIWDLGFGQINQHALVIGGSGGNAITMTILANIPQIFLSVIYILYLGIMTSMFLAADWSTYAFKAQTLMLSTPAGKQRSTWFLGAPLGWGFLLLSFLTALHWLLSQSIFIVQITVFDKDGKPYGYNSDINEYYTPVFSNCGYSPIAIICATLAAGILLLSAIIFCWRRFPEGAPPVVGTCSAAISAACHPIEKTPEMLYGSFRWGANGGFSNGVGHCALVPADIWNAGRAEPPVPGHIYAGVLE